MSGGTAEHQNDAHFFMERRASSTFEQLHDALARIVERAKESDTAAVLVRQSLESMQKILSDPLLIVSVVAAGRGPSAPPPLHAAPVTRRVVLGAVDQENAKEFLNFIFLNTGVNLQHKDLVDFAMTYGPKHGLYPTRDEKRNKNGMLLWMRRNYHILESDFNAYLNDKPDLTRKVKTE